MCGRMTQQTSPSEIARIFDADDRLEEDTAVLEPRFNVAPTDPLTVVLERGDEGRVVEQHRWGLVPSFATSLKEGAKRINARAETVASSPAFRASFRARRCIVPSDGFYEWRRAGSVRQPFLLHPPTGAVMAMAGLWAVWKDPATGSWVPSAAVITTEANRRVATVHDRMPVLLPREVWDDWLDRTVDDEAYLLSLLVPAPDAVLEMRPVSTKVNDVRNQGPELIEPVTLDAGSDDSLSSESEEAPTLGLLG
jgi:putative SOS response-associated peptidase YedK